MNIFSRKKDLKSIKKFWKIIKNSTRGCKAFSLCWLG